MKSEAMAALNVDSSQSGFLQQEEGNGNQVRVPSRGYEFHVRRVCVLSTWVVLTEVHAFQLGEGDCTLIWTSQAWFPFQIPPLLLGLKW